MMNTAMPEWAYQTIISAGLGFDVAGLNEMIWADFLETNTTLKPESHQRFFHLHLAMRIKTGWVEDMRQNLANREPKPHYERPRKLSPNQEFENKMANFDFNFDFSEEPEPNYKLVEVPDELVEDVMAFIQMHRSGDWDDFGKRSEFLLKLAEKD